MTANSNKAIYSNGVPFRRGLDYPFKILIGNISCKVQGEVLTVFDVFFPFNAAKKSWRLANAQDCLLEEAHRVLHLFEGQLKFRRLVPGSFEGLSLTDIEYTLVENPKQLELLEQYFGVYFQKENLPIASDSFVSSVLPFLMEIETEKSFEEQYEDHLKGRGCVVDQNYTTDLHFSAEFVNNGPNTKEELEGKMPPEYYEGMPPDSAFHKRHINIKGKLGEFTKIEEEVDEIREALEQSNKPLALIECFDLLGAIHHFLNKYNLTLEEAVPYVMQYDKFRESLKEKK